MAKIAKRVTITDVDTGEIIKDSVNYGTQNGVDWVIWYRKALESLATDAPLVALKVLCFLASKQEFENGIKITKKFISEKLNISAAQLWRGFKWLKENGYVKEHKVNGITEFVLNPNVTTCGKNRKAKIELWNSIP